MSVNSPQTRSLPGKLTGLHIQSLLDTEAKPEYRRDERALEIKMTHNGRCLNYNHGRPNAPVRYCPMCGEVVNNNISAEVCSEEKHTKEQSKGNRYCVDCSEQLNQ